ncbi:MAG: HAD family hydrolase [Puniceicoccales bacterium]|jgi:putative hydrolase of the HAD superfamily|nr:HAD family hydrolase [Puniceicoccales bacterium]
MEAQKMAFRAVVFDLDDTLFPERDYVVSGFKAVGEWLEKEHGVRDFFSCAMQLFNDGIRGRIFNEILARYERPFPADIVEKMVSVYRAHNPTISLASEVIFLLHLLRENNVKTGIITDGFLETQRKKVTALQVEPLVDKVIYSDAYGRAAWKPSVRAFREMETALSVKSAECLYIGDNPAKDFIGARNAGWRSLRLRIANREHSNATCTTATMPDWELSHWHEIASILAL